MIELLSFVAGFAIAPVANGYVVALATVCCVQYFNHLMNRGRLKEVAQGLRREVDDLCVEMRDISRDRTISRLENQILRDVLGQAEFSKSLEAMLKRFIPNPTDDFAAIVQLDASLEAAHQSRGLDAESLRQLMIDPELVTRLRAERGLLLSGAALQRSRLLSGFSTEDRRKVSTLYLIGVGDNEDLFAVLVTTRLIGIGVDEDEQIELSKRLMATIAGGLRQNLELRKQAQQLQFTQEMLELRTIADASADQPMRMIERFLSRLVELVAARRATVFLNPSASAESARVLVQVGEPLGPTIQKAWELHERSLATVGLVYNQMTVFERSQLERFQIDSLISSAITIPLTQNARTIGLLVLTREHAHPLPPGRRQLVAWAGGTLSAIIQNALSLAAMEREARQDGLTHLANRRTFDTHLKKELERIADGRLDACSLLLFDLDRFKLVNDTYGHQGGDAVLRETASLLRREAAHLRSTDRLVLARYGGEELAVLLPGINLAGAIRIAESLRRAIETTPVQFEGKSISITSSVGVAVAPYHGATASELLTSADQVLYQAKTEGRNRVCVAAASAPAPL
ncbi:MAG: GGDEF domain-containing protein [Planctomycetaceae bacterium]|nr:GGDEF domain-containing protein [Planctomycetaceae bacterium]